HLGPVGRRASPCVPCAPSRVGAEARERRPVCERRARRAPMAPCGNSPAPEGVWGEAAWLRTPAPLLTDPGRSGAVRVATWRQESKHPVRTACAGFRTLDEEPLRQVPRAV